MEDESGQKTKYIRDGTYVARGSGRTGAAHIFDIIYLHSVFLLLAVGGTLAYFAFLEKSLSAEFVSR